MTCKLTGEYFTLKESAPPEKNLCGGGAFRAQGGWLWMQPRSGAGVHQDVHPSITML